MFCFIHQERPPRTRSLHWQRSIKELMTHINMSTLSTSSSFLMTGQPRKNYANGQILEFLNHCQDFENKNIRSVLEREERKNNFAKIPRELYKHLLPTARHSLVSHCMLPYPLIFRIHSLLNNRSRCFANANYQTDAISIIDCRKRSFELQIRCTYVISVLCNSMWPEI